MRIFSLVLLSLLLLGFSAVAEERVFSATQLPDRWFISPELWPNPWENWQIRAGEIRVSHPSPKNTMTLQHLSCALNEKAAPAEMEVVLRQTSSASKEKEAAGFVLGIRVKDPIDDYRSRLLFGSGLEMGITANKQLFIGKEKRVPLTDMKSFDLHEAKIRLHVALTPTDETSYTIRLSASAAESGFDLGSVELKGVSGDALHGNVALFAKTAHASNSGAQDGYWAFNDWKLSGDKFSLSPEQEFGPILWSQYTLSKGIMKLTAQMAPIGLKDSQRVVLEKRCDGVWQELASAPIDSISWTAPFRIEQWDDSKDTPYRLRWVQHYANGEEKEYYWRGRIAADPKDQPTVKAAIMCCFMDYLFPNRCVVENLSRQKPDLMMHVGDQIYENVGGWGVLRTGPLDRMCVNYLRKLALWGWSFRDLMKDRPTVTMPDDHDVYQGNLWGAAGRKIPLKIWDKPSGYGKSKNVGSVGGYVQPADFVKAIERTQTSHLPDPATTETFEQGIGAYYTDMTYGGIGFAILEDRKFKTGPQEIEHRHAGPRPDHISEADMAEEVNDPNAKLLGDEQLAFVQGWACDWKDQEMKAAISQTTYCGVATHHGAFDNYLLGDMDCGGWPQLGRNKAVDALRRGGVILLAGDQHLPSIVRQGIEQPGDGIVCFVTPAGATGYQRWWRPDEVGIERFVEGKHEERANTGIYKDGFGNIMDVLAVGNPPLKLEKVESREDLGMKKSAGWGLASFNKKTRTITLEAWRVRPGLDINVNAKTEDQFPGWPMSFDAAENFGLTALKLPAVLVDKTNAPIVRVIGDQGELVSAGRAHEGSFVPTVYTPGAYTVEVLSPEDDTTVIKRFIAVSPGQEGTLKVE